MDYPTLQFPLTGKTFHLLSAQPPIRDFQDLIERVNKLYEAENVARADLAALRTAELAAARAKADQEKTSSTAGITNSLWQFSPSERRSAAQPKIPLTEEQKNTHEYQEYLVKRAKYEDTQAEMPWCQWEEYPEFVPLPPEEERDELLKLQVRRKAMHRELWGKYGRPTFEELKANSDAEVAKRAKAKSRDTKADHDKPSNGSPKDKKHSDNSQTNMSKDFPPGTTAPSFDKMMEIRESWSKMKEDALKRGDKKEAAVWDSFRNIPDDLGSG